MTGDTTAKSGGGDNGMGWIELPVNGRTRAPGSWGYSTDLPAPDDVEGILIKATQPGAPDPEPTNCALFNSSRSSYSQCWEGPASFTHLSYDNGTLTFELYLWDSVQHPLYYRLQPLS